MRESERSFFIQVQEKGFMVLLELFDVILLYCMYNN